MTLTIDKKMKTQKFKSFLFSMLRFFVSTWLIYLPECTIIYASETYKCTSEIRKSEIQHYPFVYQYLLNIFYCHQETLLYQNGHKSCFHFSFEALPLQ